MVGEEGDDLGGFVGDGQQFGVTTQQFEFEVDPRGEVVLGHDRDEHIVASGEGAGQDGAHQHGLGDGDVGGGFADLGIGRDGAGGEPPTGEGIGQGEGDGDEAVGIGVEGGEPCGRIGEFGAGFLAVPLFAAAPAHATTIIEKAGGDKAMVAGNLAGTAEVEGIVERLAQICAQTVNRLIYHAQGEFGRDGFPLEVGHLHGHRHFLAGGELAPLGHNGHV